MNILNKQGLRKVFRKGFRFYFIYVFLFAILFFALQRPKKKVTLEEFVQYYYSAGERNKERVELVESGKDGALVRLNLIANAGKNIDISYYIFIEGMSTDVILGSILDAADRGVKVRLILDGIFNNFKGDLRDSIYGFALHPNIELRYYEPFKLLSPITWNTRMHDKIILIDEEIALIGGRNLGDKYFLEEIEKERFSKDRDVLIFKEEPLENKPSAVDDMRAYFNKIWDYEHTQDSIKSLSPRQEARGEAFNQQLIGKYNNFKKEYEPHLRPTNWRDNTLKVESIRFVYNPIGRANQDPWCLRVLLSLASLAEESIFIQSPYIIPTRSMKSRFEEYDIDYKKITILTNSLASTPNPLAMAGYANSKERIGDSGVEVHEYQGPDSIHSKTYIIDHRLSVVGSFNLDARSSYINTESMVIISSEEFAKKLKAKIQEDLNNSLKVDKNYSYIEDAYKIQGHVSAFKEIKIWLLAKIVYFVDYLL